MSIHVERSIRIDRSPEELYQFWRNFENLPRFMNHLQSVQVLDAQRSRWAKPQMGNCTKICGDSSRRLRKAIRNFNF
jgi:uncharacterized membrane protein